jgi:hypothetical protein
MSKPAKVALLVATLWPLCGFGIFFIVWLSMFAHMTAGKLPRPTGLPPEFAAMFGIQCFTMRWIFGLLAVYITNVFRNPRVRSDVKPLWAVVLFLGSFIAMPVPLHLEGLADSTCRDVLVVD